MGRNFHHENLLGGKTDDQEKVYPILDSAHDPVPGSVSNLAHAVNYSFWHNDQYNEQ